MSAYERASEFLDRTVADLDGITERQALIDAKLARRAEIAQELIRLTHEHDLLSGEIYVLTCEEIRYQRSEGM